MAESFDELIARSAEQSRREAEHRHEASRADARTRAAQQQHQGELTEVSRLVVRESATVFRALKGAGIKPDAQVAPGEEIMKASSYLSSKRGDIYTGTIVTPINQARFDARRQRRMDKAQDRAIENLKPHISLAWATDSDVFWSNGLGSESAASESIFGEVLLGASKGDIYIGWNKTMPTREGDPGFSVWDVQTLVFENGNRFADKLPILNGVRQAMANLAVAHGLGV